MTFYHLQDLRKMSIYCQIPTFCGGKMDHFVDFFLWNLPLSFSESTQHDLLTLHLCTYFAYISVNMKTIEDVCSRNFLCSFHAIFFKAQTFFLLSQKIYFLILLTFIYIIYVIYEYDSLLYTKAMAKNTRTRVKCYTYH